MPQSGRSHPAGPKTQAAAASPPAAPATHQPNRDSLDEPMIAAAGPWTGPSLKTAGGLAVPIGVGAAVGVFILVQALIDRRDPKVSDAPQRGREDTVGFE